MKDTVFFKQAELLLRILPMIYKEDVFALKGGTAINFFIRDLPRLSVDIDLTYLPVNDRDFALNEIRRILLLISEQIKRRNERRFIVSMKQGQPVWDLLGLEGIKDLPAVKWKLLNISKMDPTKHRKAVHKLRDYLGV